jgi:predicted RNA binding protein YcfA (HicA-like mRNA interferase family)
LSGDRLVLLLKDLGYESVRQKGSHIRLRHTGPPLHLVTVPRHDCLKVGTLQAILTEVAFMRSMTIESILQRL